MNKTALKNTLINANIAKLLETHSCHCGSSLRQTRSGAKTLQCQGCNARFKAKTKKKQCLNT